VDRSSVWIDTVKRGPMVRQVRGLGTLVPEEFRWLPATTEASVEKILIWPGTKVESGDVILELTRSCASLVDRIEEQNYVWRFKICAALSDEGAGV
jgi:hypothetical protein